VGRAQDTASDNERHPSRYVVWRSSQAVRSGLR